MKTGSLALVLLACAGWFPALRLVAADAEPAAPPPYFVLKDTWQQTVLASREALLTGSTSATKPAPAPKETTFTPAKVEMTGKDKAKSLKLSIAGLRQLHLGASGPGEAFFGNPRLLAPDGKATPLRLGQARAGLPARWRHDGMGRGWTPIRHGDGTFQTGACLQENDLALDLDGKSEYLEVTVGVLPTRDNRPVRIWVDVRPGLAVAAKGKNDAANKLVWTLAAEKFSEPAAVCEQRIEQAASIWAADWRPGDCAELARRYAAAAGAAQKEKAGKLAAACQTPADLQAVRDLFYVQYAEKRLDLARRTLALVERAAPRPELAGQLAALEKQLPGAAQGTGGESLYLESTRLRRRIILSHPELAFDKLLFNKRSNHLPEHMCDQYLGRHSQAAPGLAMLDSWKDRPRETLLLQGKLPVGATIHPDLSFDGTRVLFAFANHEGPRQGELRAYFVYELDLPTGKVRQVTGATGDVRTGEKGRESVLVEDFDPCYLPDGGFAFISTRSQQFGRCHGARYVPSYTLHRGQLDGSGIRELSLNEANEWGPSVLHDGTLVYTRWDYINRHDVIFQSLWTMRPDGTNTAHYYGNNSPAPCLIGEAQAIPGADKVVSTAAAHHGQTMGTLIIVDPSEGQDHGAPLTWLTPELRFPEAAVPAGITCTPLPLPEDLPQAGGRAATPVPITEDLFLCTYPHGAQHALYLVDTLGGRELIYADPQVSCFDPLPVRPRPMPPALPSALPARDKTTTGVFIVQDVYQSDQPIPAGSIQRLRVNAIISQPTRAAPGRSRVANEIVKKILGTVPVNADGSVAFEVPASTPMQLQLLDENGMAVMTMRSLVYVQPGERAACMGCHEPRSAAPPALRPASLRPVRLTPPAGPSYPGGFSYVRTVQPVLDRYCIGCHGLGKAVSKVDLLGTLHQPGPVARPRGFSVSYDVLTSVPGLLRLAPRNGESFPSRPKDYFAHAGRLARLLLDGHPGPDGKKRVTLDRDSFQRLVDWMDLNGQFYGDYSWNRIEQQPPLPEGEKALRAAIEKRFGADWARQPYAALVNVANPAESRILMAPLPIPAGGWGQVAANAFTGTDDAEYKQLRKLVEESITPLSFHDIAGTCGRGDGCRCGECWVRLDRAGQWPPPAAHAANTPR